MDGQTDGWTDTASHPDVRTNSEIWMGERTNAQADGEAGGGEGEKKMGIFFSIMIFKVCKTTKKS